jgi:hypothetical protein
MKYDLCEYITTRTPQAVPKAWVDDLSIRVTSTEAQAERVIVKAVMAAHRILRRDRLILAKKTRVARKLTSAIPNSFRP